MDTEGRSLGKWCETISNWEIKCTAQSTPDPTANVLRTELDYKAKDWTLGFRWATPGNYIVNYLQRISPNLSLGTDFGYSRKQAFSLASFGARYTWSNNIFAASVSQGGLSMSVTKKVCSKEHLGVSLSTEFQFPAPGGQNESACAVGVEYRLPVNALKVRVASDYTIHTIFEELSNGPKLVFCSELNHQKKTYKFGLGLSFHIIL